MSFKIMDNMSNDSPFCEQYLSKFIGIKSETIKELLNNEYDSIQTLLALDLTRDLNDLKNITLGQKSLLRKALTLLKEECDQWKNEIEFKSNNNNKPLNLNSTPILAKKSIGFVDNNYSFNELIEKALTTSFSAINGQNSSQNTINSELSLSPIMRSNRKLRRIGPKVKDNENESQVNDRKSVDKSVNVLLPFNDNLSQNNDKKKRKPKKFKYTMKRYRKRESDDSFNINDQSNRCLSINIDSDTEEIDGKPMDNNYEEINSFVDSIKEVIDSEEEVEKDLISLSKSEIMSLLREKSDRIQYIDLNESLEFNTFHKRISVDGLETEFVSCNKCLKPHVFKINGLKQHINWCKVNNQYSIASESMTEEPKNIIVIVNDRKRAISKEELLKSVEKPLIALKRLKIEFNESTKRYTAEDVIINNYSPSLLSRKSLNLSSIVKPYKCSFKGCNFSALYPFSLEQHKITHKKNSVLQGMNGLVQKHIINTTPLPTNLNNNSLINSSDKSVSNQPKSLSETKPEIDPEFKSKLLYCRINECNYNCQTYYSMKRHKISVHNDSCSKLTVSNNSIETNRELNDSIKYKCQSTDCMYGSLYKLSVKKHMLNNHNMEYKDIELNSSIDSNSESIADNESNDISVKIVNKIQSLIRGEK